MSKQANELTIIAETDNDFSTEIWNQQMYIYRKFLF